MTRRNARAGLFTGWWTAPDGRRIRKAKRHEYAEAYRLWAKHKDIRTGTNPLVYQGVKPLGERSVLHNWYDPSIAHRHSGSVRMTSKSTVPPRGWRTSEARVSPAIGDRW